MQTGTVVSLNSPNTFYKLASFYEKIDKTKAIKYFNKTLSIEYSYLNSHFRLARLYEAIKENKKAIFHFEYALLKEKDKCIKHIIRKELVELYLKEQLHYRAQSLLLRMVSFFGNFGFLAVSINKLKIDVVKSYEYKREYEGVLFKLAYTLREEGFYKLALLYTKKLLRVSSKDKSKKVSTPYLYLLATTSILSLFIETAKKPKLPKKETILSKRDCAL